jgi:DNA-directed RNA polymerase specialized sigma24 family protein
MAPQLLYPFFRHLLPALGPEGRNALTDGELLTQWIGQRDQAAFELLVRRHGPMVWAACRRLLADPNDVDDAFQATWLVLVRKAGSVRRPKALAAWLHRVALRVALRARAGAARRRSHERPGLADVPADSPPDGASGRDLRTVLDEEIDGCPSTTARPLYSVAWRGRATPRPPPSSDDRWGPWPPGRPAPENGSAPAWSGGGSWGRRGLLRSG